MKNAAFGLIDAQRGFMPVEEGDILEIDGFGELPIPDGQRIVPYANALLDAFDDAELPTFTTQDWHPQETAHFSEEPNYTTTWPVHCVAETPGAELHPDIDVPAGAGRFTKGSEALLRGEDDTSYSGYNGLNEEGEGLGEWLDERDVTEVVLGGLALDYCVKATALDLRQRAGLAVTVISDATAPVAQETGLTAIDELEAAGVHFATTDELLRRLAATAE